jgi:hypothetical protein
MIEHYLRPIRFRADRIAVAAHQLWAIQGSLMHTNVFWALSAHERASGENLCSVTVAIDR